MNGPAGHAVWLAWAGFFLIWEAGAIAFRRWPTLSETWWTITARAPLWLDLLLTGIMAATLFWLTFGHWIARVLDRPGLEPREAATVIAGLVFGVLAALARRSRLRERQP